MARRGTDQRLSGRLSHAAFWLGIWVVAIAGLLYLLLPTLIVILASLTASDHLAFPPQGLSLRWFRRILAMHELHVAAWRSLWVALAATTLAVLLGVAAAFPLVRVRFVGRDALDALLASPLVLPSLVYGLAALMFVTALGFPLSGPILILGHVAIIFPFVIRTTAASLALLDPHLEEAARSLGANTWQTFWRIVLPNLFPGILTGAAFAFITSFDNLTVSLFLAGPRQETLPIRLFAMIQFDLDPAAAAISTLLIALTLVVVLILQRALGLSRLVRL